MLSEHKDTILENFLSSAIRTLNTDEIYNILIDSLILLLNPQGLLLTQNLNTRRSFYTVRRWGDIFFEKDYSVPSDAAKYSRNQGDPLSAGCHWSFVYC